MGTHIESSVLRIFVACGADGVSYQFNRVYSTGAQETSPKPDFRDQILLPSVAQLTLGCNPLFVFQNRKVTMLLD